MATELTLSAAHLDSQTSVVTFVGSLDATNIDRAEAIVDEQMLGGTVKRVILDFSALEYLNSRAVGFLVSLSQKVAASNAMLILAALRPNVDDIITVVGLNQIIPVAPTVEEAKTMYDAGEGAPAPE